jgi:hypothetical protein
MGDKSMCKRFFLSMGGLAAITVGLNAQQGFQRRAEIRGSGNPNQGKCTIEVVVDGAAEVEIRGDNAVLRNLSGQPPQWRRFECTGVMPPNPAEFRFAGVDGRGRQELVRDPRNGGTAVVRIEDRDNGAEGYTFDIMWGGNQGQDDRNHPNGPGYDRDRNRPTDRGYDRGPDRGDDGAFYRTREQWFRGDNWRGRIFDRVREDVEYVRARTFPLGADQYRLVATIQQLNQLQSKLDAGRYDERELDDVIAALGSVVRDNRLAPGDREVLNDDLNRLRDFRARHDYYGARVDNGGRDDIYHRDRDQWFRGQNWRAQFFQRVRDDIEHVQSEAFPFGADQYRLARTKQELDQLQNKLANGRYDQRQLDSVIASLQRVVQDNRLARNDRELLNDDLNRLRDFRARHDYYGAR